MVFNRKFGGVILLSAMLVVSLAACSGKNATPTLSPEMVYTQAAQTVAAGLTQTAVLMPTATSTPTLPPTNTPSPTRALSATVAGSTTPVTLVSPTKSTGPDKAVWVAQTPGDGTVFTPGEDFTLVWTVKNTGTSTWNTGYQLRFFLGDPSLRFAASDIKLPKEVKPNESVDLSLWMEAPHNPGDYTTIWVLTNDQGGNFYTLTLTLKVAGPASVEVPSATPTATP